MAQHRDKNSMLRESLSEMVEIANHCLKNPKREGGYYGFPAAILLLSVIDAIGAHTPESSDRDKHFFVLNNEELFGLNLKKDSIVTLYQEYRNMLFHENLINPGSKLRMGREKDIPFEISTNEKIR